MEQWRPSHRAPGCIFIVFRPWFYFIWTFFPFAVRSTKYFVPILGVGLVNSSRSQPPKSTVANLNEFKLHWKFSVSNTKSVSSVLHGLLNLVKCNSSPKPKRGIPWIPCAIQLILQLSSLRQGEIISPHCLPCSNPIDDLQNYRLRKTSSLFRQPRIQWLRTFFHSLYYMYPVVQHI